jgi:hypothetical protein
MIIGIFHRYACYELTAEQASQLDVFKSEDFSAIA